jgi:hypothetical protein
MDHLNNQEKKLLQDIKQQKEENEARGGGHNAKDSSVRQEVLCQSTM